MLAFGAGMLYTKALAYLWWHGLTWHTREGVLSSAIHPPVGHFVDLPVLGRPCKHNGSNFYFLAGDTFLPQNVAKKVIKRGPQLKIDDLLLYNSVASITSSLSLTYNSHLGHLYS